MGYIKRLENQMIDTYDEKIPKKSKLENIRTFLAFAREHNPYIPEDLTEWLAILYSEIRRKEIRDYLPASYTTARTLLSIIRMSQAIARLRFSNQVSNLDIEESLGLLYTSKSSLIK